MGRKHKKSHRSDWELQDDNQEKKSLKLIFKIKSDSDSRADSDSESSRKKKRRHDYQIESSHVQTVEVCTDDVTDDVIKLSPERQKALNTILENLLKELQRKDPQKIFAWPVSDVIAPGYSQLITSPMDFSTMTSKLENNMYQSLGAFRADFDVMIANCKAYNKEDTIYHKAARKLKAAGRRVITDERLFALHRQLLPSMTSRDFCTLLDLPDDDVIMDDAESPADVITDEPISFTDADSVMTVAPDSIAAAKSARNARLLSRPRDRLVTLENIRNDDVTLNILNPDRNESSKIEDVKLSQLTALLGDGIDTLPVVKEDKRNKITPVQYLGYGAFSSFGPSYDSRISNMTQQDSDLLLRAYGGDDAVLFARSMQDFVSGCDVITRDLVDEMVDEMAKDVTSSLSSTLDTNAALLRDLQEKQNLRLKAANTSMTSPSDSESLVAGQLRANLTSLSKQARPADLYDVTAVRQCYSYEKKN